MITESRSSGGTTHCSQHSANKSVSVSVRATPPILNISVGSPSEPDITTYRLQPTKKKNENSFGSTNLYSYQTEKAMVPSNMARKGA
ncbi:craniofacial development protein 2 [Biomphalaria glabrata]